MFRKAVVDPRGLRDYFDERAACYVPIDNPRTQALEIRNLCNAPERYNELVKKCSVTNEEHYQLRKIRTPAYKNF